MTLLGPDRRIVGDWHDAPVPAGVDIAEDTHVDTSFCFLETFGRIDIQAGAHIYTGSSFDVGPHGRVSIGRCAMLNGVYVLCDRELVIGAYATISWNVVFMDTYRMPFAPEGRRRALEERARLGKAKPEAEVECLPVCLQDNVWIGFDVCVLPGVTIGEGSVVGARSVVAQDVPPYTVVAGNPARPIRSLPRPDSSGVERA